MTSRERILTALDHNEPDRVPIDLGGMRSTGIHAKAYRRFVDYLGYRDLPVKVFDVHQMLAFVDDEIRREVHSDAIELKRLNGGFETRIDSWNGRNIFDDGSRYLFPDGFDPKVKEDGSLVIERDGVEVAAMPRGGHYFDRSYFPLAHAGRKEEISALVMPRLTGEEIEFLKAQLTGIRESTDCAVIGAFGGNFLEAGHSMFGYQEFMERLITDRPLMEFFLDRLLETYLVDLEKYLSALGDDIDIIQIGDDYGTQENTAISPRIFRSIFKPRLKTLCDFIHRKKPDLFIFLHSCGSVYTFIPDFIEVGVQILNPVQTNAKNMEPERLKNEFGRDIVFWGGGCDTQHVLPFGTLKDLEDDIRRRIDIFSPGGGFVFSPIHNIQAEVPPEKIFRLFECAYEYGSQ
ncbi:uroporphyrinogen-III decarboxylase [Mesotoga prima MesG1.Ag.4.2]|uniref:Uroporphyrinogen-III decarboxylase n=1 Tax=Mesotoga prima MesG1.Ag.4.2 TaxID=660470 RepID=I2F1L1_9BACT|nr:uroporphyrinogen decarboxylase family protein [Mesotoga prima]AFK05814.1 uroporphyrinogen-III decarboxylase [Mesotoga prima MesG1.Ag.4.2]